VGKWEHFAEENCCAGELWLAFFFLQNNTVKPGYNHIGLYQRYSTFFIRVPPDLISLQLCTPKVVGA
jgi:hypothetical protein